MSFLGGLFGSGKKIVAPTAKQSAQDALAGYQATAPDLLATNQNLLPAFAALDSKVALQTADQMAQGELDLQRKYAPAFIGLSRDLGRQLDPNAFDAYDTLGQQVLANLKLGNTLNPQEMQMVEQSTRAGQAARGNLWGNSAALNEALNVGNAATARGMQRRGEALAFLGADPVVSQGINLSYDAPTAGGGLDTAGLFSVGQQASQQNLQAQQYNASRTNPWLSALGSIGGAFAGSYAGAKGAAAAAG